jgi:hypothetical protein
MEIVRRRGLAMLAPVLVIASSGVALASAGQHRLPPSGKLTTCHSVVYRIGGTYKVSTSYGKEKGKHAASSRLSCSHANNVALKGKRYFSHYPFGVGKKVRVAGVTYTLDESYGGRYDGQPTSGPLYGWVGGGVVIVLRTY